MAAASTPRRHRSNQSSGQVFFESLESRQLLSVSLGSVPATTTSSPAIVATATTTTNLGTLTGLTITATAGVSFSGTVATWKWKVLPPTAFNVGYYASIQWGDGTITRGTLVTDNTGLIHINGTHTYAKPGDYITTIRLNQYNTTTGAVIQLIAQTTGEAIVNSVGGVTIYPTAGKSFTGIVGRLLNLPYAVTSSSHYAASINWGDGTAPSAGIILLSNVSPVAGYPIQGTHTYAQTGHYHIHIIVTYMATPTSPSIIVAQIDSTAIVTAVTPVP